MITSTRNPQIQHLRALQTRARARREAGEYIIEGVRLAEEALRAGLIPKWVLYTEGLSHRGQAVLQGFQARGAPASPAADHVLQAASDTKTPQGLLAILPIPSPSLPRDPSFVLVLDGVRDPGNLGTILRTARAAAVDAVLLSPGSVDPFAPKVVRSAMGAHFRLAVGCLPWDEIADYLLPVEGRVPLQLFLAEAATGLPYTQADFRLPLALIVGGESEGASSHARNLNPLPVHIPMPGETESLNAAVAAGVLIYEVVRQRQEME